MSQAKKPKEARKCIHCLVITSDWNWDHVFPREWYPESTPQNLEKWQVPSCVSCNSDYGRLENDLMIRVGLCLDPKDPKSFGIPQKAIRAISPRYGRDPKDRAARLAKRKEVLGDSVPGKDIPDNAIYPGFENRWGQPKSQAMPVNIPAKSIRKLSEKIIKGIFLLEDKKYVEPPFKISFFAVHEAAAGPVKELLAKFGRVYAREPGIVVHRAVAPEDGLSSVYFIEIWGQFRMYGAVERE